jgi:tetratricopeptide (TPR) repeat protein/TolB-like protein
VNDIVASLLSRDRDDRPATANDVLVQLRAISGTANTAVLAVAKSRRPRAIAATAAVVVLLGAFGLWGAGRFSTVPPTNGSGPPVIAVFPLANISGDASKDFVAAGISESLISSLATLPTVTVLSRASVNEAQTRLASVPAVAKELGTTYLVEGSLHESAGTVRVSLNLVRRDRTVAWADSIEGRFDNIFELQSQLASRLAQALSVGVSAAQRERMSSAPTTNPEALSAYWQGMALMERRDVKGTVEAAISSFGVALRSDPRFALAHAGLGQAYRLKYIETRDPAWAQRAIEEAANALRIDPDRAEVRYVMGLTLSTTGRLTEATEELNHALAIQPNFEDARRQLGEVLADQGQIDAAVAEFQKAIALRPNAAAPYRAMGLALVRASRYEQAVAAFEQVVAREPDNFSGYQQLGTAYQFLGRVDEALVNYRKALAIRPSAPAYSNTGALLHQKGDFKGAVDAYQHAIEIRPNSSATRRNLGDALRRLGRSAEAKAAYLEAVRLGEADLKVNPSDPRLLASQAVYLHKAGQPASALERINAALARAPDNGEVLYRAAVIKALDGNRDQAMTFLERAVQMGYSRLQIRTDDDLASLSNDARYRQLATVEAR